LLIANGGLHYERAAPRLPYHWNVKIGGPAGAEDSFPNTRRLAEQCDAVTVGLFRANLLDERNVPSE
jgi:hypothetical protein